MATKAEVIKRLAEKIEQGGLLEIKMDETARAMNVSKKTLFKMFGNKKIMLEAGAFCIITKAIHQIEKI